MQTADIITLAATHQANSSSAQYSLRDAMNQQALGNADAARMWAIRSLAHSVGIFSTDYQKAMA